MARRPSFFLVALILALLAGCTAPPGGSSPSPPPSMMEGSSGEGGMGEGKGTEAAVPVGGYVAAPSQSRRGGGRKNQASARTRRVRSSSEL